MLTFHTADSHAISVRAKQYQRPEGGEEGGRKGLERWNWRLETDFTLFDLVILSMIRKIRKNPNN